MIFSLILMYLVLKGVTPLILFMLVITVPFDFTILIVLIAIIGGIIISLFD